MTYFENPALAQELIDAGRGHLVARTDLYDIYADEAHEEPIPESWWDGLEKQDAEHESEHGSGT